MEKPAPVLLAASPKTACIAAIDRPTMVKTIVRETATEATIASQHGPVTEGLREHQVATGAIPSPSTPCVLRDACAKGAANAALGMAEGSMTVSLSVAASGSRWLPRSRQEFSVAQVHRHPCRIQPRIRLFGCRRGPTALRCSYRTK